MKVEHTVANDAFDLVGRDIELAKLSTLVGSGRLVTVTGPGGVGKTTLVRRLADSTPRQHARSLFIDLTSVDEPGAVESAMAAALGQPRFATISASTFNDDVLLIVDNCEHVVDAAASAISQLRAVLPSVAVCTTSRTPLRLRDESVLALAPLDVPPERTVDATASAVELFLSLARRSGATVAEDDLGDICELCRRVDGIPLAIEIAATRTRSMAVGEILQRLGDELDKVSQGGFRRDERHRSVRDTVEWSYQLLDANERDFFDCLGVIGGRFSAAMAKATAGNISIEATLDRLDQLVAASLLLTERSVDGRTWYRQLNAVRACARQHLSETERFDAAAERFVDHMVGEAIALAGHARDGWRPETVAAISGLADSLLLALRWATEHDDTPYRAFELATVLWGHQSRTDEVLEVTARALERWPDKSFPRWADAAATVATCLWIAGRTDEADRLIDRALPDSAQATSAAVLLRRTRGQIRREQQRYDEAIEWLSDAVDAARERELLALVLDAELLGAAVLSAQGNTNAALAAVARMRDLPVDPAIAEVLALSIEADVLLSIDPSRAVVQAQRGIELAGPTSYSAAMIGFYRIEAIGLILQHDLLGAAAALDRAIEAMSASGVLSQAGAVLEAVALLGERAGVPAWSDLARAGGALPSTDLLSSPARLLPEIPAAKSQPLSLADALALSRQILDQLSSGNAPAGHDDAVTVPTSQAAPAGRNRLQRRGDHWEIEYAGQALVARHSKGVGDLARLMAKPDTAIPAVDLIGVAVVSSDTGEVLDASARRQYEQRIRDLQAELVEAEDNNDLGRVEQFTVELDALVEQLSSAVGLGGRSRRGGGSNERARTAVTRRIRTAIVHLDRLCPALGRHLEASVRTGTYCTYRPEFHTEWDIYP